MQSITNTVCDACTDAVIARYWSLHGAMDNRHPIGEQEDSAGRRKKYCGNFLDVFWDFSRNTSSGCCQYPLECVVYRAST